MPQEELSEIMNDIIIQLQKAAKEGDDILPALELISNCKDLTTDGKEEIFEATNGSGKECMTALNALQDIKNLQLSDNSLLSPTATLLNNFLKENAKLVRTKIGQNIQKYINNIMNPTQVNLDTQPAKTHPPLPVRAPKTQAPTKPRHTTPAKHAIAQATAPLTEAESRKAIAARLQKAGIARNIYIGNGTTSQ